MFSIFLSAILAILSHPTVLAGWALPNLGGLAWVSYIPLLGFLQNKTPKEQARLSFLFALLYYFGTLYWLYFAMNGFGHLSPFFSVLVLLILVLILSSYFASIFFVSTFIERHLSLPRFLVLPCVWVGVELCRNYFPVGGFPWAQAGYSQWQFLSLIQIADLTGVYGVTALLILGNLAGLRALQIVFNRIYRPVQFQKRNLLPIFSFLLVFVFTIFYGRFSQNKLQSQMAEAPTLRLALIQGNIPQDEKWAYEKSNEVLQIHQNLTQRAVLLGVDTSTTPTPSLQPGGEAPLSINPEHTPAFKPESRRVDLVIWPESAYPLELGLDVPEHFKTIGHYPVDLLLGAVTYFSEGKLDPDIIYTPLGYPIYNSGLLLKPDGTLGEVHHKAHLVPYGEYIPLKSVLPFLNKLTNQVGEFQVGEKPVLINTGPARIGLLICYEDIFPELTRRVAGIGANLLVNLTNDAWYENSSALPQHLSFSAFRAVESRLSLVRATNTGVTATFGPDGALRKRLPVFERGFLLDEVNLMKSSTFYTRHGDLFAQACLIITLILFLTSCVWRRKNV